MTEQAVRVERTGAVTTVILDRAARRNAQRTFSDCVGDLYHRGVATRTLHSVGDFRDGDYALG